MGEDDHMYLKPIKEFNNNAIAFYNDFKFKIKVLDINIQQTKFNTKNEIKNKKLMLNKKCPIE